MPRPLFAHTHLTALGTLFMSAGIAAAEVTCYGVNAGGTLFHFPRSSRLQPVVPVGNLGFVPKGIDFLPGSDTLYAIDIGPGMSRLYTIDIASGAPTPVGAPFPSVVPGSYDLVGSGSMTYGFNVDPSSLQPDGSVWIRVTSSSGQNLRLNSATGQVAAVDHALESSVGGPVNVDAIAYSNSDVVAAGGATTLYALDFAANALVRIDSHNDGNFTPIGPFGPAFDILPGSHLDIFTLPGENVGLAYAAFRTADSPLFPNNTWIIAGVNLGTGAMFLGSPVGPLGGSSPADFTGGFSVNLPAPSTAGLALIGAMPLLRRHRRLAPP